MIPQTPKWKTLNQIPEDSLKLIDEKIEGYEEAFNEEAMQWQESAENEYDECHEISKKEYEKLLEERGSFLRFSESLKEKIQDYYE